MEFHDVTAQVCGSDMVIGEVSFDYFADGSFVYGGEMRVVTTNNVRVWSTSGAAPVSEWREASVFINDRSFSFVAACDYGNDECSTRGNDGTNDFELAIDNVKIDCTPKSESPPPPATASKKTYRFNSQYEGGSLTYGWATGEDTAYAVNFVVQGSAKSWVVGCKENDDAEHECNTPLVSTGSSSRFFYVEPPSEILSTDFYIFEYDGSYCTENNGEIVSGISFKYYYAGPLTRVASFRVVTNDDVTVWTAPDGVREWRKGSVSFEAESFSFVFTCDYSGDDDWAEDCAAVQSSYGASIVAVDTVDLYCDASI